MGTTMKGLLKGLRFISHIFEEEKEPEIQIGNPTDVKHVAHIGWDGPSTDPPSWMKDFKTANQSAPSSSIVHPTENSEIQWGSGDSRIGNPPATDQLEQPKSSRRRSSTDKNGSDSPKKKDSSTKTKHSRRNHSKESSEGGSSHRSNRQPQELGTGTDSPQRDVSKKSRRKKSKETGSGDGSSRSRSKGGDSSGTYKSSFSDTRPDPGQGY